MANFDRNTFFNLSASPTPTPSTRKKLNEAINEMQACINKAIKKSDKSKDPKIVQLTEVVKLSKAVQACVDTFKANGDIASFNELLGDKLTRFNNQLDKLADSFDHLYLTKKQKKEFTKKEEEDWRWDATRVLNNADHSIKNIGDIINTLPQNLKSIFRKTVRPFIKLHKKAKRHIKNKKK